MCAACAIQLDEQPREQHRCPICRADLAQWLADEWSWRLEPEDLHIMALSLDTNGYHRLRVGSSDDLEQLRDELTEDVRVLATIPGGGFMVKNVHTRLHTAMIPTESGVAWFNATLPSVLRVIALVIEELQP
jgi:hypothetical protein